MACGVACGVAGSSPQVRGTVSWNGAFRLERLGDEGAEGERVQTKQVNAAHQPIRRKIGEQEGRQGRHHQDYTRRCVGVFREAVPAVDPCGLIS